MVNIVGVPDFEICEHFAYVAQETMVDVFESEFSQYERFFGTFENVPTDVHENVFAKSVG